MFRSVGNLGFVLAVLNAGCSVAPVALSADVPNAGGAYANASVTGYTSSNAILTTGYSDRELGPDHVEVRVKGSVVTSAERLEKIASARAAEIGVEEKRKFFKVGSVVQSVVCTPPRDQAHKGGRISAEQATVLVMDVVYAKEALDGSYRPSGDTFDRLTRELLDESVSAESKMATAAAVQARCGK